MEDFALTWNKNTPYDVSVCSYFKNLFQEFYDVMKNKYKRLFFITSFCAIAHFIHMCMEMFIVEWILLYFMNEFLLISYIFIPIGTTNISDSIAKNKNFKCLKIVNFSVLNIISTWPESRLFDVLAFVSENEQWISCVRN